MTPFLGRDLGVAYVSHTLSNSHHRKNVSYCHICLKRRKTTKEHIPPKAALNRGPRNWDVLARNKEGSLEIRRVLIRDGHFARTLCRICNSRCSTYANEYGRFVRGLIAKPAILDPRGHFAVRVAEDKLRIAKQVATMILATEWLGWAEQQTELRKFVLDPDCRCEPPFRVLSFLVPNTHYSGTLIHYHGRAGLVSPDYHFLGGEISLYPFGFVYAEQIGVGYRPWEMADITSWFGDKPVSCVRFRLRVSGVGGIPDGSGHKRVRPQLDWLSR